MPSGTFMSASLKSEEIEPKPGGTRVIRVHASEPSPEEEHDPKELRGWLLLWDKLIVPDGEGLYPTFPSRNCQFLQSAGVVDMCPLDSDEELKTWAELETAHPEVDGSILVRPAISLLAFRKMEATHPGRWSIATEGGAFDDLMFTEPGRAILFKLHQALPIPSTDTPLNDILEFRLRRSAERIALRHHLEQLFQSVIRAGDGPLALRTEFESLASALRDITAVSKESGLRFKLAGIEARLKWEFNPLAGLAGAGAASLLGSLPAAIASMAVGVLPKVEVNTGAGLKGGRRSPTPYEYGLMIQREL